LVWESDARVVGASVYYDAGNCPGEVFAPPNRGAGGVGSGVLAFCSSGGSGGVDVGIAVCVVGGASRENIGVFVDLVGGIFVAVAVIIGVFVLAISVAYGLIF
jgi:hypothetical protein